MQGAANVGRLEQGGSAPRSAASISPSPSRSSGSTNASPAAASYKPFSSFNASAVPSAVVKPSPAAVTPRAPSRPMTPRT